VFLDELENLFGYFTFADHAFRRNAGDAVRTRRKGCEPRAGFLIGLGAHDIGDTQPLLAMIAGFDDTQHDNADADARGPAARVVHGAVAFGRVVDDHQELRLVTSLVAPSPTAHRTGSLNLLGLPAAHKSPLAGVVQWCHDALSQHKRSRTLRPGRAGVPPAL